MNFFTPKATTYVKANEKFIYFLKYTVNNNRKEENGEKCEETKIFRIYSIKPKKYLRSFLTEIGSLHWNVLF